MTSITGYNIIEAEDLDAAERIAALGGGDRPRQDPRHEPKSQHADDR